ncbi:3-oxoacyl-(acyl carrier protein) synthase I [Serratia rubidaea]|uniref:3-oxoacyl-(Acyl carrier protein) synthase I n=1 Tax=Serratia rubidaea TaxID=61652 RepID=A0A4U9HG49_SERRU|nr:3-oxoacyl-(acyl carrier protein) synthase I [Serratia rubidaea]
MLQPLSWPGLSDEMVASLDNAALWAYKVGHEALEQGKLPAGALRDRTALIIGVSSAGTEAFIPLIEQRMEAFSLQKAIISGSFASCSAIVSSLLGLKGGFELVATACTASTNAMGIGYDLIQNGKNSTALVVGTEPIYLPTFAGFYALHAMKRTPSSPFSGSPACRSAKAPARCCWKSMSTRWRAARPSTVRWCRTPPPATPTMKPRRIRAAECGADAGRYRLYQRARHRHRGQRPL